MKCPYCGNEESSVLDTRMSETKETVRRKRSCMICHRKFTTLEKINHLDLKVIKKQLDDDGHFVIEDFSIEKLHNSIKAATGKKTKPELVEKMYQASIAKITSKKTNQIQSTEIGNIVLKEIGKVSPSAYLRFACEYMGLESLDEVKSLIEKFKK